MLGRQIIIGIITAILIVFWLDPKIIDWFMSMFNSNQSGLWAVRFCAWCLLLYLTWKLTIRIAIWVGAIFGALLSGVPSRSQRRNIATKSKWQERLEEMQKKQAEQTINRHNDRNQ